MHLWFPYNCLLCLNKRHVIIGQIKTNSYRIERSCLTYGHTHSSDVTAGAFHQLFKATDGKIYENSFVSATTHQESVS